MKTSYYYNSEEDSENKRKYEISREKNKTTGRIKLITMISYNIINKHDFNISRFQG